MHIRKPFLFLILFLGIVIIYQDMEFADTQRGKLSPEVKMDQRIELMSLMNSCLSRFLVFRFFCWESDFVTLFKTLNLLFYDQAISNSTWRLS